MEFKVKCIRSSDSNFTVGNVYTWKNGEMKDNHGFTFDKSCESSDPNKWRFCGCAFERVPDIKVGDTVRATEDYCNYTKGKIGKVLEISPPVACVDFGIGFDGHQGHSVLPRPHPTATCWNIPWSMLELVTEKSESIKIVISANGEKIFARLHKGGEVLREAYFESADFNEGAEIAFNRLMERKPVQQDKPVFVPYLEHQGNIWGNLGDDTDIKDHFKNALRIGDTVLVYREDGKILGERAVVKGHYSGEIYIDEIVKSPGYTIILELRFEDIKDGEIVNGISYIKTPRK